MAIKISFFPRCAIDNALRNRIVGIMPMMVNKIMMVNMNGSIYCRDVGMMFLVYTGCDKKYASYPVI